MGSLPTTRLLGQYALVLEGSASSLEDHIVGWIWPLLQSCFPAQRFDLDLVKHPRNEEYQKEAVKLICALSRPLAQASRVALVLLVMTHALFQRPFHVSRI